MNKSEENKLIKEFLREHGVGDNRDLTEEEIEEAVAYKNEIIRFFDEYPRVGQYLIMGAEMAVNNSTNLEILRKSVNEVIGYSQIKVEDETEEPTKERGKKKTVH